MVKDGQNNKAACLEPSPAFQEQARLLFCGAQSLLDNEQRMRSVRSTSHRSSYLFESVRLK